MVIVYTTCSTDEEAKKIAGSLLSQKLISAANYFPTRSIYSGDNGPSEATEWILLVHTEDEKSGQVAEEIEDNHSYELPVIAKIPVIFNREYVDWMYSQLR